MLLISIVNILLDVIDKYVIIVDIRKVLEHVQKNPSSAARDRVRRAANPHRRELAGAAAILALLIVMPTNNGSVCRLSNSLLHLSRALVMGLA